MLTMVETPDILLVEDDKEYVEAALRAFAVGHVTGKVFVVRDGAEALEFLFGEGRYAGRDTGAAPKVVLLDLHLPFVDGLEVLREMKTREETRSIPVVMLTSSEERNHILRSHEIGADMYFVKPVHAVEFRQLAHMLGQYGVRGPIDGSQPA